MLYVVHLKNKKSPKGGSRAPQDPPRYALDYQFTVLITYRLFNRKCFPFWNASSIVPRSRLNDFAFRLRSGKEMGVWSTLIRVCRGRLVAFLSWNWKTFSTTFLHDLFCRQEPHDCCQVACVFKTIYTIWMTTRGQRFQPRANFEDAQKTLKLL